MIQSRTGWIAVRKPLQARRTMPVTAWVAVLTALRVPSKSLERTAPTTARTVVTTLKAALKQAEITVAYTSMTGPRNFPMVRNTSRTWSKTCFMIFCPVCELSAYSIR